MSIRIALSKGRIFEETAPLLKAAGIVASEDPEVSRKLIIPTNRGDVSVIIVRASDVPTYVQYGAADLGIAGKDVLLEHGGTGLYQPLDLWRAQCAGAVTGMAMDAGHFIPEERPGEVATQLRAFLLAK